MPYDEGVSNKNIPDCRCTTGAWCSIAGWTVKHFQTKAGSHGPDGGWTAYVQGRRSFVVRNDEGFPWAGAELKAKRDRIVAKLLKRSQGSHRFSYADVGGNNGAGWARRKQQDEEDADRSAGPAGEAALAYWARETAGRHGLRGCVDYLPGLPPLNVSSAWADAFADRVAELNASPPSRRPG